VCQDDRFDEGNPYQITKSKNWDGLTLEEVVREAISRGVEKEIALLIRLLPDEVKAKYRELWKELKGGSK